MANGHASLSEKMSVSLSELYNIHLSQRNSNYLFFYRKLVYLYELSLTMLLRLAKKFMNIHDTGTYPSRTWTFYNIISLFNFLVALLC